MWNDATDHSQKEFKYKLDSQKTKVNRKRTRWNNKHREEVYVKGDTVHWRLDSSTWGGFDVYIDVYYDGESYHAKDISRWKKEILDLQNRIKDARKKIEEANKISAGPQYVGGKHRVKVRLETWYGRYLQATANFINNFHEDGAEYIHLIGVLGHVQFAKRTRDEWTALLEDIDQGVIDKSVYHRPISQRVNLNTLTGQVETLLQNQRNYVIVASVPSRVGDDHDAHKTVRNMMRPLRHKFPGRIGVTFSFAGNIASTVLPPHLQE